MAFIEEQLLSCITDGSAGGPTFRTRKIPLRSGFIRRNPVFSLPLYRFQILYRNLSHEQHQEVVAAFNACFAGVHSFRWKDWEDYQAAAELLPVAGTGSSQQVQLVKTYTFGNQGVVRPIKKPVAGTVTMTANGSPVAASINTTTGIATLTAANGALLRWTGEFDVPVMFEQDELPFAGDNVGNDERRLTANVPLMEDRSA